MDAEAVIAAFRCEDRTVLWPGETLDAQPFVTRRISKDHASVTAFALSDAHADESIREEIAYFARLGRTFEWKAFSFDEPPNLVDRLRRAGFSVEEPEALVVYDLAEGLGPFNSEVEVRQVTDEDGLKDYRRTAEAAFGKDHAPTTNALAEALRTGDRTHEAYVAYLDGEPAAVGRLYTNPDSAFAGLYGGGTRPEHRGRGLYRAVVAARARVAAARSARYLLVDAMPTSFPILCRLGFVHVADSWPCASPATERG